MKTGSGSIFVVGIGPGNAEGFTIQAKKALETCDVIAGYSVYVDLVKLSFPELENKIFFTSGMKAEIERCQKCFEYALQNKKVCLVCSGDAGVYGMAEPVLSLQKNPLYQQVEVVVIPGVSAALSGAAILGAPLNHDFCVISLSDLLTPWTAIEKRLRAAVFGDFAIAIYNPSSHKRKNYLAKACQIMLEAGCENERVCAYVQNIGRTGEQAHFCTIEELINAEVDMFTTVFVGNSQSEIITLSDGQKRLITKRGYKIESDDE